MTLSKTLLAFLVATTILSQVFISGLVSAQDDFIPDEIPTTSRSEETVVAWDNFASADGGLFAEQPREPDDLRIAYDDGQFEIDALPEDFSGNLEAPTFDAYSDATLAVDGVLVGFQPIRTSPLSLPGMSYRWRHRLSARIPS